MKRTAEIVNTTNGTFYVVFGFEENGEMVVSRARGGRYYKTQKAAEKAIAAWKAGK